MKMPPVPRARPTRPLSQRVLLNTTDPCFGGAGGRNRRNLEWGKLAQRSAPNYAAVVEVSEQGCASCSAYGTGGGGYEGKEKCTENGPLIFGPVFKVSFSSRGTFFLVWVGRWSGLGGGSPRSPPPSPRGSAHHLFEAIFLGVVVRALGMRIPIVPAHLAPQGPLCRRVAAAAMCPQEAPREHQQPTKCPTGNDHHHSQAPSICLLLCRDLGILYHILQWYCSIGAKSSPHQISPFQMSHLPNPPPPPPSASAPTALSKQEQGRGGGCCGSQFPAISRILFAIFSPFFCLKRHRDLLSHLCGSAVP